MQTTLSTIRTQTTVLIFRYSNDYTLSNSVTPREIKWSWRTLRFNS